MPRHGDPTTRGLARRIGARVDTLRKRLEVAHRRALVRSLSWLVRRRRAAPAWEARRHDVLFLRPDRVGDMIISTGLLRAIATSHPTIRLHVLATPWNAAVLDHNPHVASVVLFHRRRRPWTWLPLLWRIRRARYDAVVDCMVFSPSLTLLLLMVATGARERIGIGGRANDAVYSVPVAPVADRRTHHIEQLGALAAAFGVGVEGFDWRPEIVLSPAERAAAERLWARAGGGGRRLLVNVSAGKARCRWPTERYCAVLAALVSRRADLDILVIGMPRDADALGRIVEATGCPIASPGLRDTFALVASADLLLTPDTGLVHAASAFRTPVVAMYHRGAATHWGPYRTAARIVSSPGRTLEPLPAEPVLAAVEDLLAAIAAAPPQAEPAAAHPAAPARSSSIAATTASGGTPASSNSAR